MRLLDILRCNLSGKLPRTRNLNAVVVYRQTDSEIMLLPPTMAKCVDKSFLQRINQHFKMFLTFETFACNAATERKVFEAEINTCLKEFEEITLGTLVVTEQILSIFRTHMPAVMERFGLERGI